MPSNGLVKPVSGEKFGDDPLPYISKEIHFSVPASVLGSFIGAN
jgi:hypothetical protein